MVLEEAKAAGYVGEVITTAELRTCIDAGWQSTDLVMNGPGKRHDKGPKLNTEPLNGGLRCLFADSVADLTTIVDRVLDPKDWLEAEFIGVRFSPAWVTKSRFGVDAKDPRVLELVAEQLRRLPKTLELGFHLHFASSTLGPPQWFGVAHGHLQLVRGVVDLLQGRQPKVLDFGGGWPAHLLDDSSIRRPMTALLERARHLFPMLDTVQFEPGKSVTERAGALVTRVLEIRELDRKIPRTNKKKGPREEDEQLTAVSFNSSLDDNADESVDGGDGEDSDHRKETPRAIIVDACIGDMGSLSTHLHPLLWKSSNDEYKEWIPLAAGKDQVWGSICMEFDKLGTNIDIPEDAKAGDYIVIAFTGAYDMTMSYVFANGRAREAIIHK